MRKLIVEKLPRIIKNKKKLEEILDVSISHRGKEIYIEGEGEEEYFAEKVIDALDFGFSFSDAVELKKQGLKLIIINIKDHAKKKDLKTIRGRIIGTKGKALKTISNISDCSLEIKRNKIGIIGHEENVEKAREAIISLIKGSKHSNVFSFLERQDFSEPVDLGLRNPKDKPA